MIDFATVKIFILEHWVETLIIGILLVLAGGVIYYNRQQFSTRRQFLEGVSSVPGGEWGSSEVTAVSPGQIYERMVVTEPAVEIYIREGLPPVHRWGEPVNVLGLKVPSVSLQSGPAYVGPTE